MPGPTLVLSHPPHGSVDFTLAAPLLEMTPADVRLKANYSVPEIWMAESDAEAAEAGAARLRAAGLRVAVVPGVALAEIPARNPVASFAFEDGELVIQASRRDSVAYGVAAVAVLFTPRPGESKGNPPAAFLDLYAVVGGGLGRWTFLQGTTGFTGMGTRQSASFGTNVHALADDLRRRFATCTVDERLVNMQVRRRVGSPPPGAIRRGYSFATGSLNELLDGLRAGLSAMDHEELASRLAFLTRVAG